MKRDTPQNRALDGIANFFNTATIVLWVWAIYTAGDFIASSLLTLVR